MAILEYDGGMSREDAERAATDAITDAAGARSKPAQRP